MKSNTKHSRSDYIKPYKHITQIICAKTKKQQKKSKNRSTNLLLPLLSLITVAKGGLLLEPSDSNGGASELCLLPCVLEVSELVLLVLLLVFVFVVVKVLVSVWISVVGSPL
jgi:hypothetical protein